MRTAFHDLNQELRRNAGLGDERPLLHVTASVARGRRVLVIQPNRDRIQALAVKVVGWFMS